MRWLLLVAIPACDITVTPDPAGHIIRQGKDRGCVRTDYINPARHVWYCSDRAGHHWDWEEPF